jgi:hypothetical protein
MCQFGWILGISVFRYVIAMIMRFLSPRLGESWLGVAELYVYS